VRYIFLILLIAAGIWGYFFLQAAGYFRTMEAKFDGTCKPVTANGFAGPEDITIDTETNIAYLSGYDRRAAMAGHPAPGAIWAYNLADQNAQLVNLTPDADAAFLPHGISLYRAPNGKKTLFVINHGADRQSVDIFDVDPGKLTHRRTVTGADLISPNDIVGVGSDQFFVTNDHANAQGFQRQLEDYLRLKLTTVRYYDGAKFYPALKDIGGANGINATPKGDTLFVSAGSEQKVYVYDRNLQTGAITQRAAVEVPGYADNIELLPDGSFLLGVHSKILDLLQNVSNPAHPSPSRIMRLMPDGHGSYTAADVYVNMGQEISGASVGAAFGKRLLIGDIFEPKFLDCDWPSGPDAPPPPAPVAPPAPLPAKPHK
jgi:arylesterase/paraoxonase